VTWNRRRAARWGWIVGACACAPAPPHTAASLPDAVVLERTQCFGTCPAYEVAIRGRFLANAECDAVADTLRTDDSARSLRATIGSRWSSVTAR
jgi:hypothetical protein